MSALRFRILVCCSLLLVASIAGAAVREITTETGPRTEVVSQWRVLEASSAGRAAIDWNPQTGTSRAIFGRFQRPAVSADEGAARAFLVMNRKLFGIDDVARDLVMSRRVSSPMGTHVTFRQRYRGVEVEGGETSVHFDRDGDVIAVNNTHVPGIGLLAVAPAVDLSDAVGALGKAARSVEFVTRRTGHVSRSDQEADLRAALGGATGQLVVYRFGGRDSLAWKLSLNTDEASWEAFVDARTGAVIGPVRDLNRYVNGTGRVFPANAIVATRNNTLTDQNDSASAVPDSAYITVTLQGLAGNGFLDGQFASSAKTKKRAESAAHTFAFDRSSDGFSETMGYYYFDYAERYIQSLGFSNVNNRQQVFSVNRFKKDNSFYSPGNKEITLGTGGVDDAEDAEVILHEYGHSIQDDQTPGFGSSLEAGSIGEGFGDYWGATVNAQFSGGFQDECLAEWDAVSYSSTNPPCLRRLDGTKHYPESVVGQVHADGEMWSAALWQIRAAIGAIKADRVVLQSHFLMTVDTSFNQAANATVTAAINLGYTATEVQTIRTILRNRGFTVTA